MGDVHNMKPSSYPPSTDVCSPVAYSPLSGFRRPSQSDVSGAPPTSFDSQHQHGERTPRNDLLELEVRRFPVLDMSIENSGLGSRQSRHEDNGHGVQTIRELKKQLEELLALQQAQRLNEARIRSGSASRLMSISHDLGSGGRISSASGSRAVLSAVGTNAHTYHSSHSSQMQSDGILGSSDQSQISGDHQEQIPSHIVPKIRSRSSVRSQRSHASFRGPSGLAIPIEDLKLQTAESQALVDRQFTPFDSSVSNNIFLPPKHKTAAEDSSYPSPNLYDLTLQLNTDAGLENWWSSTVTILQRHYGAERASLAVPGDATDLENVPWGQKAVFNQYLSEEPDATPSPYFQNEDSSVGGATVEGDASCSIDDASAGTAKGSGSATPSKRPPLLSRYSFAGFDKSDSPPAFTFSSRSQQLVNIVSSDRPGTNLTHTPDNSTAGERTRLRDQKDPVYQASLPGSSQGPSNPHQAVFVVPRSLEAEGDPLIKRSGVVKLFGRTTPVVLTREYAQHGAEPSADYVDEPGRMPNEGVQLTPTAATSQAAAQTPLSAPSQRASPPCSPNFKPLSCPLYDEYEQIPPSPWTQSPAPSPAPRSHPEQDPFFTSHAVDETAFTKHPPAYDYSRREPLEAIGVDHAKSVIHIPLIHAGCSKRASSCALRFPVAVISILSPINPYPANLRQSLTYLTPHLTNSFCLAQKHTQLEYQLASRLETPRYGHLLGLGGTFSDESSELELVAGLSGHVNYTLPDGGVLSARASVSSPDGRTNSAKASPSISGLGTPGFDLPAILPSPANNSNEHPEEAIKSNGDSVDNYFSFQRYRSLGEATSQYRSRIARARQVAEFTATPSTGTTGGKPLGEEFSVHSFGLTKVPSQQESKASVTTPYSQNMAQRTNSLYSQLQCELARPFSDTVLQLMLNSVPLHLFLAKPQSGEIVWTNSKFDAYRRSQLHGQRIRDPWQNIHSSERDHISRGWANALRTGSQFTERVRVKRCNDESAYRWFIFRANPLILPTGEVLYWIGSFLDIHEQHITELKAAQEREKFATDAKYRAFSNSIPQIVFEAAEYRGLIFANEQWHLYTGQKLDEAMGFGFAKHVHPDDLERCCHFFQFSEHNTHAGCPSALVGDAQKTGTAQPEINVGIGVTPALNELVKRGVVSMQKDENGLLFYSTEIRLRSKGGDFRWHLVRLIRVEASSFGSEESSWYGTCTDINDRKNLERELNNAMQQLNDQMEFKTKFFSNMSHEIRTPLNGILGTIPFILDTTLDADQRRMLDTIQNSSTNLRELVDNILDVSRVEAGKMSLVNSWFHVRSVIEDVIDTVASRAIDKGLEINYLMNTDVPAMVVGDRFRVRQVLVNLVGNAVKFTARGEIYISCSIYHNSAIALKETEVLLNFDVVDTGKGFSAGDAQRLMHRFSQLGSDGSQNAGSGLGLFLSKQLVEMHGGKLTPSGNEGRGARFSFYVKVDVPPLPTPEESASAHDELQRAQSKPSSQESMLAYKQPSGRATGRPLAPEPLSTSISALQIPANLSSQSSLSSASGTPELYRVEPCQPDTDRERDSNILASEPSASASQQLLSRENSAAAPGALATKDSYTIMILCPLDNARSAIKQHIEQVVPLDVPYSITSVPDVEDWRDMVNDGSCNNLTHVVLNVLNIDDCLEVIQYVSEYDPASAPTLVVIVDLHQKRQVNPKIKELSAGGRRAYTVPKPIKPSAFSIIFDPDNQRDLSKDRNRDMARESNNNFRTMSKMVKEVLGNKGYRILLVEDDETNRMVMLKYLDKVNVLSETAGNGQECTELVFSKEPGYYSLIICDIQMPIKNGYQTCRDIRRWELKNHYPQIPIMALSANAMTDQIEDAARAGFNDYVTKPIKHNELGKMMMGLLDPNRPLILLRDRLGSDYSARREEDAS